LFVSPIPPPPAAAESNSLLPPLSVSQQVRGPLKESIKRRAHDALVAKMMCNRREKAEIERWRVRRRRKKQLPKAGV
jgi:hypothetical protein